MQRPLGVDANSSCSRTAMGTGSCHESRDVRLSAVAIPGEPQLLLLHSRHRAKDQAHRQSRGMRQQPGGGTTTSVLSELSASKLHSHWQTSGLEEWLQDAQARLHNRVSPGTSGEEQRRWTSSCKETMCLCKSLSVPSLLEKTNTSVFLKCVHWEQYQIVLLEHGRTSGGFE